MDLYAVTGELVIQWGMFEAALNAMIALLYHDFNGKAHQPTIPIPFGKRLKLHKECFNKEATLAPYAEEARAIRSLAKETSFVREYLAHGYVSSWNTETGVYTFRRFDTDDDDTMHVETVFKSTALGLADKSAQIEKLIDMSHVLINKLFAITPRLDKGDDPAGSGQA